MANVVLINKTKKPPKMLVLNLAKNISPVKVENRTIHTNKTGKVARKISSKLVPDSIRIPARGELLVDEKILLCPEVKKAIQKQEIAVKKIETNQPETVKPKTRAKKR